MRNLPPPTSNPRALYEEIAQLKGKRDTSKGERLRGLREVVWRAYEQYEREKPHLERIRPLAAELTDEQQGDLRDCYKSRTDPLSRLRADIISSSPRSCQYCTLEKVTDLDHYLPQKDFPEFSVLPINLVPSCGSCNTRRSWISHAGKRALIHLYFDTIPQDVRLLFAAVHLNAGVPQARFKVDVSGCADGAFAELYLEHVKTLKLLERYEREAVIDEAGIDDIRREVINHCSDLDADGIRTKLLGGARHEHLRLGPNHWKVALRYGLAESSDAVINWLRGFPCV
ncbi:MAG TPA: hypothetical protein VLS89_18110 [Candidatus Nanopelagicales bacterium]|nr:hypothetical protein [Candidatus Nanopelagicales bacterium]